MSERGEWNRQLFETLTSNRVSRNKYYAQFANESYKAVHSRYRVVTSLKREAGRLAKVHDTGCWVAREGEQLLFHLHSPRLFYKRAVALEHHEWEWLHAQQEIQTLLGTTQQTALSASEPLQDALQRPVPDGQPLMDGSGGA